MEFYMGLRGVVLKEMEIYFLVSDTAVQTFYKYYKKIDRVVEENALT